MNMNKQLRKFISVDSSPHYKICDFAGFHPTLCYHLNLIAVDQTALGELYKINIDQDLLIDDRDSDEREKIFKQMTLTAINADNWKDTINAAIYKLKSKGIILKFADGIEYLKALKKHHEAIKHRFNSDSGVELM